MQAGVFGAKSNLLRGKTLLFKTVKWFKQKNDGLYVDKCDNEREGIQ